MTTAPIETLPIGDRVMIAKETLAQIGRMNVLATSGGRYRVERWTEPNTHDYIVALELPVSSGYSVRVTLAENDTYTVQRIMRRGPKTWVKGTVADVYCEELGDVVYVAGCYKNRSFGAHKVEG